MGCCTRTPAVKRLEMLFVTSEISIPPDPGVPAKTFSHVVAWGTLVIVTALVWHFRMHDVTRTEFDAHLWLQGRCRDPDGFQGTINSTVTLNGVDGEIPPHLVFVPNYVVANRAPVNAAINLVYFMGLQPEFKGALPPTARKPFVDEQGKLYYGCEVATSTSGSVTADRQSLIISNHTSPYDTAQLQVYGRYPSRIYVEPVGSFSCTFYERKHPFQMFIEWATPIMSVIGILNGVMKCIFRDHVEKSQKDAVALPDLELQCTANTLCDQKSESRQLFVMKPPGV